MNDLKESDVGTYKLGQLNRLEMLYDKLKIKFNFGELARLSREELRTLTREAYSKFKKGGYGLKVKEEEK